MSVATASPISPILQTMDQLSIDTIRFWLESKYTGAEGHNIGIETFGASAPLKQLLKKFGFTVESVVAAAKSQIALHRSTR